MGKESKNTLGALNNVLFQQLNRLNDDELSGDALDKELQRSKGLTDVAKTIISNANLALKAMVVKDEKLGSYAEMPAMLETGKDSDK